MEQKGNGVITQWSCEDGANRPICSIVPAEQRNSSEHCYVLPIKKLTQHYPKQIHAHYFSRKRGSCFSMSSGKLLYHQEQHDFELNGIVLCPGMWIEHHISSHGDSASIWIPCSFCPRAFLAPHEGAATSSGITKGRRTEGDSGGRR